MMKILNFHTIDEAYNKSTNKKGTQKITFTWHVTYHKDKYWPTNSKDNLRQ